jgi:restriction system protein
LEALVKGILGLVLLIALAIGGLRGFVPALVSLFIWIFAAAAIAGICYLVYRRFSIGRDTDAAPAQAAFTRSPSAGSSVFSSTQTFESKRPEWDIERIEQAIGEIDWYQFEKFCAALLRADGFSVERKGGAHPDGGVDLIAEKPSQRMLVQCKHWRTWNVKEGVIREMLGSMTHFEVTQGAIYTLKGWTAPAGAFAAQHAIALVDGRKLSERAIHLLEDSELNDLLDSSIHHCPKCEAPMIWREGDFTPFWGCSTYPRCRAVVKHTGAR